ncbi:DUF4214 domain-containing protein [Massilia arenosa]|uniref:DUF4214 domain-containing protein n=1 Tax=Zemynaea arenosa TaxID=2561931 RepID=A0A4Y9SBY3_9BURK|nr:DUF4214 domain-containing protein [Massilia arenosa]TFW17824.1 DUF4214 domain-containing protein [Massilia arenosa]
MATPSDDFTASTQRAGRLAVGATTSGQLEAPGDADWFAVQLEAGKTYAFGLQGEVGGGGSLPLVPGATALRLYGPGMDPLDSSFTPSHNLPTLAFTPRTSGTYYLAVTSAASGPTGTYTVSAREGMADDVGDSSGTATRLLAGETINGMIGTSGDLDVFRVSIQKGHVYTLTQPGSGLAQQVLEGLGAGAVLSADGGSVTFRAAYTGDLNVVLAGPEGKTGGYSVHFEEAAADDVGSTLATAGTLAAGVTLKGQLDAADSDWYKLPATAGYAYAINVSAGVAPTLSVLGAASSAALPNGGIYIADGLPAFLAVDGSKPTSYDLTATLLADDYRNAATSAARLNSTVQGKIDYTGDTDYFTFSVKAGEVYGLGLGGQNGTLTVKPVSNATLIGSTPTSGATAGSLVFQAQADGMAVLAVSGTATTKDKLATYTLTRATAADDAANSIAEATPLAVDSTVSGAIGSPGDIDVFKVALQAGTTYAVTTPANVATLLSDGHGGLTAVEPGQWFTPTATQEYRFVLAAPGPASYQFGVQAAAGDDLPASAATTARLTENAGVTVASQKGDRDWVAVSLDAGQTYQVSSTGSGTLALRDATGQLVASAVTSAAGTHVLDYTPAAKGTWYVEVADGSGDTRLALSRPAADDFGNTPARAQSIEVGQTVTARLHSDTDVDALRLHLDAGHWYGVRMTDLGKLGDVPFASGMIDMLQVQADGSYVPFQVPASGEFEAAASGDYVLALHRAPKWDSTGATLRVVDMGADDQAAGAPAAALAVNGSVTGSAQAGGDTDSYKLALKAGEVYTLSLTGAQGTALGPNQGSIEIQLGSQHGAAALGQPLTFMAPSNGEFLVTTHLAAAGGYTVNLRGDGVDTDAPVLTPAAEGTVYQPGQAIDLAFSENILASGGEITLRDANGGVVQQFNTGSKAYTIHDNHLVLDPGVVLIPGATYSVNIAFGAVTDLAGNPALVAQQVPVTIAAPAATGTTGNDVLVGTGVSGTLDGGAGRDTVYLPEIVGAYAVQVSNTGAVKVTAPGQEGQVFTNVERMVFANDGSALAFDTAGNGGQAYRLYQAAFDRAPDKSGLGYWINALDHGASLAAVADSFIQSAEFRGLYGTETTDTQFVNALYENVLHRLPDASGAQYWLDALANGLPRAHVLFYFSESTENVANVAPVIGHGFEYVPFL